MKPPSFFAVLLSAALAVGSAPPSALRAETAGEIHVRFESQKAEALAAYLAANPKATDVAEAEGLLIEAYLDSGQPDKAIASLQRRYLALAKGADADLQTLIAGTMQPLIRLLTEAGRKAESREWIARGKADLAGHPQAAELGQFFNRLLDDLKFPSVGEPFELAFTALGGETVDLAKMKGQVVLVDFWATWCPPCVAEMPNVVAAHRKLREKGFAVVGISLDDDRAALERFIAQKEMPWPQHFDGRGWDGEVVKRFNISQLPTTLLIGKDGRVAAIGLSGAEIEKKVAELLGH